MAVRFDLLWGSRGNTARCIAATNRLSFLRRYHLSIRDASRPTTTSLYYQESLTTIPCWSIKVQRVGLLALLRGRSGQLKRSHRMSSWSLLEHSREGAMAVVMCAEDNHLLARGVRVKPMVGVGVRDSGGIEARGTVVLEVAVLFVTQEVLSTPPARLLVHQRWELRPRVTTPAWFEMSDRQLVSVTRAPTPVTITAACVTMCLRTTNALLMRTNPYWPFLYQGVEAPSRGCEMIFGTSSSMHVLPAAGG